MYLDVIDNILKALTIKCKRLGSLINMFEAFLINVALFTLTNVHRVVCHSVFRTTHRYKLQCIAFKF